MNSSAKLEVQLLVDGFKRIGVKRVVLAPGSRNAPLTIAFDEDPYFEVFVVPDERAAAFQAMGMALKSGEPVAVACTSGSAAVNFYPAVTEAFYQSIPLIVLTADRPAAWVDQGDGQTIRQADVYHNHILKAVEIGVVSNEEDRWMAERKLAEVLQIATGKVAGPVQINLPFSEPLYVQSEQVETIRNWIEKGEEETVLTKSSLESLKTIWQASSRRLIMVGQAKPNKQVRELLEELAKDGSVAVLTEHTSNQSGLYFVSCIDRTLNAISEAELDAFRPDLVLAIGGAIVSKRIKRFLRDSECVNIRFGAFLPWMDTYQKLVFSSEIEAEAGLRQVLDFTRELPNKSTFGFEWKKKDYQAEVKHPEILKSIPWCDLKVMAYFMDVIPDGAQVHLSNSSLIRYALLFDHVASLTYWCNRGTSGIDGSSSTAIGAALVSPDEAHVLLTGDMSFFYDSNAFWINRAPSNLRVVVVNNAGGDIFNIIPGPASTNQLKKVFVSEHTFSAKGICEAYQLDFYSASSLEELDALLPAFFGPSSNERPAVLEVNTGMTSNNDLLATYFEKMK